MKKLLVIGASSGIGLATVQAGLRAGWQVRAMARSAASISVAHPQLEKFTGDALDPHAVELAVEGVDAVAQCLGVPLNLKLITGPITLFSEATRVLLPAMQKSGCRRLVAVTGFGAGASRASIQLLQRPAFRLLFGKAYADKSLQEDMIKASLLDWTLIRPGVLTNGALNPNYQVLLTPESWRNGIVSRASVADLIVRCLQDDSFIGASPGIVH